MIRRVWTAAVVVIAAAGGALLATPAHADDGWAARWANAWAGGNWAVNRSTNTDSAQSGNAFGDVLAGNNGRGLSTNVNNVNGIAPTATHGGITVTYIFY
ncbi:hypothetical protein [Nonomuraea sp. NPDC049309]|uniref:hypothetical protein n=1 Tax=Nonomuraea sp. NPDC049309 TaxID=3364350 RepID=UPI003716A3E8